jgi:hypothetical protein
MVDPEAFLRAPTRRRAHRLRDGASHAALDVFGQAHALVKDANNGDTVRARPIDDDVRADEVGLMRGRSSPRWPIARSASLILSR